MTNTLTASDMSDATLNAIAESRRIRTASVEVYYACGCQEYVKVTGDAVKVMLESQRLSDHASYHNCGRCSMGR